MGQKVHPNGLRVGVYRDWNSRWFASKKEVPELLVEDTRIRRFIKKTFYNAGVSRVEIERSSGRVRVIIHTGKPGMVIGKGGAGVEELRKKLEQLTGKQVKVDIVEIRAPELDAQLVAESVAQQLEKRVSARRAMKQAITRAMRTGAKGARIIVSGRIAGAEIARRERDWEGTVPLHTLRADIDYGVAEANTTYGKIGVKVWIYKGEFGQQITPVESRDRRDRGGRRGRGGDRGGVRDGGRNRSMQAAAGRGERRGR